MSLSENNFVEYIDDNEANAAAQVRIRADMPLGSYVAAKVALERACESPAEYAMLVLLLETAADVVSIAAVYQVSIEPQKKLLDGKYRADWYIETGNRRMVLEVDGFAYHSDQDAFRRDRQRDRDLHIDGLTTTRFTAKEVFDRPDQVRADLWRVISGL